MKSYIASVLVLLLATHAAAADGKCRALVLSGGGDKGSYQASVLTTLIDLLPEIETQYDVISGISVGSLNGATFSTFPKGQEKHFKEFVMDVWHSVNFSTVFQMWPGGFEEAINSQQAFVDNTPLINLLHNKLGERTLERTFIAGTADMNSGLYKYFKYEADHKPVTEHMYESVIASSAMPGIFPPIKRDGMVLLDGGIVWKNDAVNAIQHCRDQGFEDENIIVDWITCEGHYLFPDKDIINQHTISYGLRTYSIMDFYSSRQDIDRTKIMYPNVNFRYTISPSENLSISPVPLDFSREHLEWCIKVGEKDAREAIEAGETVYGQAILEQFYQIERGIPADFNQVLQSVKSRLTSQ